MAVAPRLIITGPNGVRREASLTAESLEIGRGETCDITLESGFVSRRHCRVARTAAGFVLADVGSRNGTSVNGRPLGGEHLLVSGDAVTVGDYTLMFIDPAYHSAEFTIPQETGAGAPISCDAATREVRLHGERVELGLSVQEFELLAVLCARYGMVCTRDELGIVIWGAGNYEYNMLHRLIYRLKAKLAPVAQDAVVAVPGVGYKIFIEPGEGTGDSL